MTKISDGHEIESRQLIDPESPLWWSTYNKVLERGVLINQGYLPTNKVFLKKVSVDFDLPTDFEIDTLRLRHYAGTGTYILTVKSDREGPNPRREVEFSMTSKTFKSYWPYTTGSRVQKKRLKETVMNHEIEIDAFTDRLLLIIECEVKSVEELERVPLWGKDITDDKSMTNKKLAK